MIMSDFKQYPHLPDEPEQSTPYPTPRHFDEPDWDDTFDDFFGNTDDIPSRSTTPIPLTGRAKPHQAGNIASSLVAFAILFGISFALICIGVPIARLLGVR